MVSDCKLLRDIQAGEVFGRLTVIERRPDRRSIKYYLCQCVCGNTKAIAGTSLIKETSRSCGCLQKDVIKAFVQTNTVHGATSRGTDRNSLYYRTYKSWVGMLSRCRNKNASGWENYGGRGITVCQRWLTFENFFADMGEKPSAAHSIERKNFDLDYTPENCYWATDKEQRRNTRRNVFLTYNNKTQCVTDWAKEIGLDASTLRSRIKEGWTIEEVLSVPKSTNIKKMATAPSIVN